jgi:glutathione S-transferase
VAVARYLEAPVAFIQTSPLELQNEKSTDALGAIDPGTPVAMLVEERRTLWETDAIACRLSIVTKSDFWPSGDLAPELQMWLSWGHSFTRTASTFYWEFVIKPARDGASDHKAIEEATEAFHRLAIVLDEALSRRSWLLDNRLTYADFRVASALPYAAVSRLPVRGYPHILKWHERLCRLSAWSRPWPDCPDVEAGRGVRRTPPVASAGGGLRFNGRRPVPMGDAVVHAADQLSLAHQGH